MYASSFLQIGAPVLRRSILSDLHFLLTLYCSLFSFVFPHRNC